MTATLLVVLAPALAQVSYYPFAIDQDRLAGAPDFSHLNRPITPADRIFIRDGHFYRVGPDLEPSTEDDTRVRLCGVNLVFGANFPTEADARRLARRLRRLGVNLARLHHMDTSPDRDPNNAGSILTTGPYPTLNPVAVRRLRTLLDALREEGIYINLNLHVGYQFRPAVDQVPALPAFPTQSKPLHILWPRMVELQTGYTRQVIEALGLRKDPVLAMVEINNESSLVYSWQRSGLDRWLEGEYGAEFKRQWNSYLSERYASTEALRAAWGGEPDGPNLLVGDWRLEVHSPAQATMQALPDETVMVRVARGGAPVILKRVGFSVAQGGLYRAEVEIRADLAPGVSRGVYWDVKQDVSPWRTETSRTISVTSQWQTFAMSFTAAFAMEGIGRLGLSVEAMDAPVHVRNVRFVRAGPRGLAPDESHESGSVSLVRSDEVASQARADDYLRFLVERDRAYLQAMLGTVRESTDRLTPVAGTQMDFGGLLNLDSHRDLDYQDSHFYIDHYNFPNTAWDGRDWRIRDSSSVGAGLETFLNIAASRPAGQPYTVSEFNQPWPNTHAAEIDPTLAIFGAFQDWDSIMHFAYSHGRNWDDGVPNGFNINGDWTKFPGFGQAAWLFRSGAVAAGGDTLDIPLPAPMRFRAAREKWNNRIAAFLAASTGYDPATALMRPVRLAVNVDEPFAPAAVEWPARASTGEFTYDREAKLFLLHAPQAAGVFGFTGASKVAAGAIDLELAPSARGFAALLLTALDGRPITESERLLVSLPGLTLRTQPESSPERPQALVNYPNTSDWRTLEPEPAFLGRPSGNMNGGSRPVWVERIECHLTLRSNAARLVVYPLDGAGKRPEPLSDANVTPTEGGFRIHLQGDGQAFSPWYEIVAGRD